MGKSIQWTRWLVAALFVAASGTALAQSEQQTLVNKADTTFSNFLRDPDMAAQAAARTIRERLIAFAAKHFAVPASEVELAGNHVRAGSHDLRLEEFLQLAYRARVALGASGFYATPKIHYDRKTFSGRPFFYFAYGAAVSEVMIDTLTGENRLLAVDILHDVGASLNPAIDRGQIEGGFLQGTGWLTGEELVWSDAGELMSLLYLGGESAQMTLALPSAVTGLFQGTLLFFLLAADVLINYRVRIVRRAAARVTQPAAA